MIAVKNLQNLNELLVQEEVLQAVAKHYSDMVSDKKAGAMFLEFAKTSEKRHAEILKYLEGHL